MFDTSRATSVRVLITSSVGVSTLSRVSEWGVSTRFLGTSAGLASCPAIGRSVRPPCQRLWPEQLGLIRRRHRLLIVAASPRRPRQLWRSRERCFHSGLMAGCPTSLDRVKAYSDERTAAEAPASDIDVADSKGAGHSPGAATPRFVKPLASHVLGLAATTTDCHVLVGPAENLNAREAHPLRRASTEVDGAVVTAGAAGRVGIHEFPVRVPILTERHSSSRRLNRPCSDSSAATGDH